VTERALRLKPLYTAPELSRALGISVHMLMRLLKSEGVAYHRVGSATLIPLGEIRDRLPLVWGAVLAALESERRP
jgi:hypothetical protein